MSGHKTDINEEMLACEQALLHTDHTRAPHLLEQMLTEGFVELNESGQESDRSTVIQWLLSKDVLARWKYSEVKIRPVSKSLCIVNYHALQVLPEVSKSKGSRHTSVWRFNNKLGIWQLHYHQSNKVV